MAWLPDSRRLLLEWADDDGSHLELRSLDSPDRSSISLEHPAWAGAIVGVTADYRVFLTDFVRKQGTAVKTVRISSSGFFPNLAPQREVKVAMPPAAELREISVSTDGKRLLWSFDCRVHSSGWQFLSRILPRMLRPRRTEHIVEVYVSDATGRRFHFLGRQTVNDRTEPGPRRLRWTADSRHFEFLYDNRLYTADAG